MPFALLNHIGPPPKNNKEALKRLAVTLAAIVLVFGFAILISAAAADLF